MNILKITDVYYHCINGVNAPLVPSRAMLNVLNEYGVHKPVRIIPTGMDEYFFTPGDGTRFRREKGIPEDRPY